MTPLKYTRQQLADALQAWVAMERNGMWWAYPNGAGCRSYGWFPKEDAWAQFPLTPALFEITDPPADWRDSLTAPSDEAKPEVCEYHKNQHGQFVRGCAPPNYWTLNPAAVNTWTYCPYCSRPIRIVEGGEHG